MEKQLRIFWCTLKFINTSGKFEKRYSNFNRYPNTARYPWKYPENSNLLLIKFFVKQDESFLAIESKEFREITFYCYPNASLSKANALEDRIMSLYDMKKLERVNNMGMIILKYRLWPTSGRPLRKFHLWRLQVILLTPIGSWNLDNLISCA